MSAIRPGSQLISAPTKPLTERTSLILKNRSSFSGRTQRLTLNYVESWRQGKSALSIKSFPECYKKFYSPSRSQSVNGFFYGMYKDHPAQLGLTALCKQQMMERMKGLPDTIVPEKMIPEFRPGCRRLTPGDGYLEAFQNPNAEMCWDSIERVTADGIKTAKGEEAFDMIVCATGFDTSFIPSWKLVGRDGAVLDERWKVNPDAFLAVQVDSMPNYFIFNGPNCVISHGSVLTQVSWTCDYILRWAKKIATEDIK